MFDYSKITKNMKNKIKIIKINRHFAKEKTVAYFSAAAWNQLSAKSVAAISWHNLQTTFKIIT